MKFFEAAKQEIQDNMEKSHAVVKASQSSAAAAVTEAKRAIDEENKLVKELRRAVPEATESLLAAYEDIDHQLQAAQSTEAVQKKVDELVTWAEKECTKF